MKPFNYEQAKAGKPVITRNGIKVPNENIYLFENIKTEYKLIAVVNGGIDSFTKNGIYSGGRESDLDLFMAPETKEMWINVYAVDDKSNFQTDGFMHETKQAAFISKNEYGVNYIGSYPIIVTLP